MRYPQPARFSAVKVQGLVGHLPALQNRDYRYDEPRDDHVFYSLGLKRLLLDVVSAATEAVSKIFDLRKSRHVHVRHNGRLDKSNTHFDDPYARRASSFCSPADSQIDGYRAATSSVHDDKLSVRFSHGKCSVKAVQP